MAIPTVTEVEEFKVDIDDAEEFLNSASTTFDTRLGGTKLTINGIISNSVHGTVTAYSALTEYTLQTEWVTESGVVYRPDPAQLPIGPESFDSSKWIVARGWSILDGILPPVASFANALNDDFLKAPDGAVVKVTGVGGGDFVKTAGAISDSSSGIQLSNATWNAAGKHLKRVYDGHLKFEWFGGLTGSSNKTTNTTALIAMWAIVDPNGGMIEFDYGEYYFDEVTLTITGTSTYKNERGFIGKGPGNTILHFDNSENVPVIENDANPAFYTKWVGFTAEADVGTKLPYFFDCLEGIPRTYMEGLHFINFKDPMRIHAWVSHFHRIESQACKIGFTWQSGTSMDISACYAITCDYGHLLGCRLEDDGTFQAGAMLSYTEFSGLAADANITADYVIGDSETCTLTSCGAEQTQAAGVTFYAPALANAVGTQSSRKREITFNNFSSASAVSGSKLFLFGRENIYAVWKGLSAGTTYSSLVNFENSLTWASSLHVALNGYSGSPIEPDRINKNFIIDGEYTGNVSTLVSGTATPSFLRSIGLRKAKTVMEVAGDEEVRIALIGTTTGNFESTTAVININLVNNSGSSSSYVNGQLIVTGQATTSGTADVVVVENCSNTADVSVTSVSSVLNTGGKDLILAFANTSASSSARFRIEIDMRTSSISGSDEHHLIYIN